MRLLIPYRFVPISMRGGIDQVACGVIRHLPPLVDEVRVQPSLRHFPKMRRRVPSARNLHFHPRPWFPNRPWFPSNDQILQRLAKRHRCTHCLYFFTRFQPPPRLPIPVYGLVHDIWWRAMPCSTELRLREDANLQLWLEQTEGIFVPSDAVRREALDVCPELAHKIQVIPYSFEAPTTVSRVPEAPRPSFYYPAQFKANKNHGVLLTAAERLASAGLDFSLDLTGQHSELINAPKPLDDPKLEPCRSFYENHSRTLASRVSARGFVDQSVVEDLYASSIAVVLPTKYEGFGLPLVEALVRGKQVICSDLPVFREQADRYSCNEFIRFFPAEDPEALAGLMAERLKLGPGPPPPSATIEKLLGRTWRQAAGEYVNAMR